jgi:hypothetical protein
MKKNYMKLSGLGLAIVLLVSSCMSEVEAPLTNENAELTNEVAIAGSEEIGGENFRKGQKEYFYQERFSNQSIAKEPGIPSFAFPGFGRGEATFLGRSFSFFNQYATGEPDPNTGIAFTVAAPVTEFFSQQLTRLGLNENEINDNPELVSSITTDGKGNSIFFNNVSNRVQFDRLGNITFVAEVKIVGGTGRFKGASGKGTVNGNVQAGTGKGNTIVRARIVF